MVFKCNRQHFPDLPEWLRFTQRHPFDNGFLYGTPTSVGKSIIEVHVHDLHTTSPNTYGHPWRRCSGINVCARFTLSTNGATKQPGRFSSSTSLQVRLKEDIGDNAGMWNDSIISSPERILPYQAEFFIKLREIEKVLPSSVQDEIQQDLQKLWDTEALEIVNITNALDRGGRVPLPLAGHFEG